MKINRADEIIKLLLGIRLKEGGENHDRPDKIDQKVEDIILRKDEFIQSDKANNVKTEVQFTKNLNETPEAYLHRISTEVVNQRESDKTNLNDSEYYNKLNRKEVAETVTRSGLLKELQFTQNENSNRTLGDINNKWLSRVIAVFLLVLLIYFLFIQ